VPILAHEACRADTILGMKSPRPAMFVRNWLRPVKILTGSARRRLVSVWLNPAWGLEVVALVATVCGAGLIAPAAVHAQPWCQQWSFNGYTEFNFPDGGKMSFISWDPRIDAEIPAWYFPPDGGRPVISRLIGNTYGNTIWLQHNHPPSNRIEWLQGAIPADGVSHGTAWDNQDHSTSWRLGDPLRCIG
jgi:hypothetical protein